MNTAEVQIDTALRSTMPSRSTKPTRSISRTRKTQPPLTERTASLMVAALAAIHAVLLTTLALLKHRNFDTYGFDFGIYDQAWWLVGQQGGGFDTVRGLPIWGHHTNFILVLLAPFARLGFGNWFLVVVQTAVMAAGALPVSWIARQRLNSTRLGVLFGIIYLIYPPTSWLSWAPFHPECLSITPFLFAIWFGDNRRWKLFGACLVVAMSTREEVAIGVAIYGLIIVWQHRKHWVNPLLRVDSPGDRRSGRIIGALTFLSAVGWFMICTKIIIPRSLGGQGAFYVSHFFGAYGDSLGEVALHLATNPTTVVEVATAPDSVRFQAELIGPLGFLPYFSPPMALIAAPQLASTLLGSQSFLREITNQYTALMIPGFLVGTIDVVARARRRWTDSRPLLPKILVGWVVFASVSGAWLRGPLPGAVGFSSWRLEAPANAQTMRQAINLIPANATVSATGEILPHLSQRPVIYNFPNPFEPLVYGLDDVKPVYPSEVDWVIANEAELSDSRIRVINELRATGKWAVVLNENGVVVLKRRT